MTDDRDARSFREGQIDARLENYDDHFKIVNGSIERTAQQLQALVAEVRELRIEVRQVASRLGGVEPLVETLTAKEQTQTLRERLAAEVAATLEQKRLDEATVWERWRLRVGVVAAAVGALVIVSNGIKVWF